MKRQIMVYMFYDRVICLHHPDVLIVKNIYIYKYLLVGT